jgi:hypothetical protein
MELPLLCTEPALQAQESDICNDALLAGHAEQEAPTNDDDPVKTFFVSEIMGLKFVDADPLPKM